MPFTWRQRPDHPAFWLLRDGERHALLAYRSRNDPMVTKAPGDPTHRVVLAWQGTVRRLPAFYGNYQRIVSALCESSPHYAPMWNSSLEIDVWFDLPAETEGDQTACGEETLAFHNGLIPAARGMIDSLLSCRAADWRIVAIASDDRDDPAALRLLATNGNGRAAEELECAFRDFVPNRIELPLDAIADLIESAQPQACRYVPTGEKRRGEDVCEAAYEPWPLSREELMAALAQIEAEWSEMPLSRRTLAAIRKKIEAARTAS